MECATTRSEFDIFAKRPVQTSVLWSRVTHYKPIAPVDQSDLEFVIPGDAETYVDLDIHMSVRGKLVGRDGSALESTDSTTVVNNLLHSLFSQCNVSLNGVSVSSSKDFYNYRAYLETILTYGHDVSHSHLTNAFWYPDEGDFSAHNPPNEATNRGYKHGWKLTNNSAEIEMYGRVHGDLFNVPRILLPGVQLQIKFTKSKSDFYVMSAKADTEAVFRFLDATLHVRHVKPSPTIQLAHTRALEKVNARYDMTRVALKTFTFGAGIKSVSIDNAVLGTLPKRLLFTMLRNVDFTGSPDTNPCFFRHFGLNNFVMYVNGRQVPSEGLSLNTAGA
jgi:hypothetical protein